MKRTIIATLLLLCCTFTFAAKNRQIFAGFQYRNEDFSSDTFKDYFVNLDGETVKTDIKNIYDKTGAISLGLATFNKDSLLVGFYNSLALTFPYYTTMRDLANSTTESLKNIKEDFKFYGLGVDWLFGPAMYLINIPILKVPVSIGGHIYGDMDWSSGDSIALKATGGIGGLIGVELHVFMVNVFVQCQLAYDFYGCCRTPAGEFNHGKVGVFSLMPQIGIGLKL